MFLLLVLLQVESRAPKARAVYRLIAIDEPAEKVERELGKLLPEHIKSFSWQRKKEPGLAHRTRDERSPDQLLMPFVCFCVRFNA